jgi:tRNA nucleotidyltransferase (CCA-adding enzyme)
LARLNALDVLRAIHPKFEFTDWHAGKLVAARETNGKAPLTYLGLLAYRFAPSTAREFCRRLKLSNADCDTLMQVLELHDEVADRLSAEQLAPSAIYRLLEEYADAALAIFALATDDARVRARIDLFRSQLRGVQSELTGDDLKKLGLAPGPAYKKILAHLRDARLDGKISTRAQELELVKNIALD